MATLLSGRYRLLDEVGTGGSARVFRALDEKRNRIVAIKYLQSPRQLSRNGRLRFYREIAAFSRMHHPHIVGFITAHFQHPVYYIVTEYVEGASLTTLLDRFVKIPLHLACGIFFELLSALEYVHDQGFIHADISPSNILITKSGLAQLTDFGLVRHKKEGAGNVLFGTPGYYSPEHVKLKGLSPRSDVFSLSLVFFEMITGQRALPPINNRRSVAMFMNAIPIDVIDFGDAQRTALFRSLMKALFDRSFFGRITSAREARLMLAKAMSACQLEYSTGSLQTLLAQLESRSKRDRSIFKSVARN